MWNKTAGIHHRRVRVLRLPLPMPTLMRRVFSGTLSVEMAYLDVNELVSKIRCIAVMRHTDKHRPVLLSHIHSVIILLLRPHRHPRPPPRPPPPRPPPPIRLLHHLISVRIPLLSLLAPLLLLLLLFLLLLLLLLRVQVRFRHRISPVHCSE
jgi:hypothetical protein